MTPKPEFIGGVGLMPFAFVHWLHCVMQPILKTSLTTNLALALKPTFIYFTQRAGPSLATGRSVYWPASTTGILKVHIH